MRILAKITKDFSIDVRFGDAPTNGGQLAILYYGIIRAMKEHHNDALGSQWTSLYPKKSTK